MWNRRQAGHETIGTPTAVRMTVVARTKVTHMLSEVGYCSQLSFLCGSSGERLLSVKSLLPTLITPSQQAGDRMDVGRSTLREHIPQFYYSWSARTQYVRWRLRLHDYQTQYKEVWGTADPGRTALA